MPDTSAPDTSYHHGDLPAALLQAVDEIVSEDGVGAVSIRAVARRAGVSHAAPAHHFGDRGGLLAAYAARGFIELREVLLETHEALPKGATAADALRAMGEGYVAFGLTHRGLYNTMFRPELVDCTVPRLVRASARAYGVLMATTRTCLDERATDEDVLAVAMLAWSAIHGFLSLQLDLPTVEVEHLPDVAPLLEPVMDLAMAGMAAHPRWVGGEVPATAVPTDFGDPLVVAEPEPVDA